MGIEQMFDWHGNGNRIETYGNGKELERSREAFPHISNCTGCGYRSASPTSSVALPMALYKYVYDYDYDKLYVLVRRSLHGATPHHVICPSWYCQSIAYIDSRRRMRLTSTTDIVVPATRRRTVRRPRVRRGRPSCLELQMWAWLSLSIASKTLIKSYHFRLSYP